MAKSKKIRRKNKNVRAPKASGIEWKYLLPVLAVTFAVFIPALGADFVNWDDPENLLENPYTAAFTWDNIVSIFHPERGRILGNYNPLPIFSFAMERALFGMNPTVFHLDNILLHLLNTALVFVLGRKLGLKVWGATLLAALFGIHPMRTESVAWVTERKDVLFAAFYFGAILTWLKYRATQAGKWLGYTILLFVLALFSKIQAVALPLSLLAIDYWQKRPLDQRLLFEKWYFFLGSLAFGLFGVFALGEAGSLDQSVDYGFGDRLLVGAYSYCVYLMKWLVPYELAPLYPYPSEITWQFYLAPLGVLATAAVFVFAWRRHWRAVVFGLAFFTFNVVFLLQVLSAGQGFLADRFTYVAYFGLFFILGFYGEELLKTNYRKVVFGVAGGYLLLCAILTFQQTKVWKDPISLWQHEIRHYDNIHTPYHNIAHYYRDVGNFEQALNWYNQSIETDPSRATSYNSRGKLYFDHNRPAEALTDYNRGIELDGSIAELWANRGAAYGMQGNLSAALNDLSRAIELDPEFINAYRNRSVVYIERQQYDLALADIQRVVAARPNDAAALTDVGYLLNQLGRSQEALAPLDRAIRLNPQLGNAYVQRSSAYYRTGNKAAALQDARQAQQLGMQVSREYLEQLQ